MHNCPICHGYGQVLNARACKCSNCAVVFGIDDRADAYNIEDGFVLPAVVDADHPLTTGE